MSSVIKVLLFFLAIFSAICTEIHGQRTKTVSGSLSDQIFLVSNYSDLNNHLEKESLNAQQLLENNVRGFIIRLLVDTDSALVKMVLPSREVVPFSAFLAPIQHFLDLNPNEVIFLFLDYNFPFFYLESELKNHHLYQRVFVQENDDNWPTTSQMVVKSKQLVCFNMQRNQDSHPGFYYLWDYAVEPYFSTVIDPEFHGSYFRGRPNNPFMFFTGFNLPKDTTGIEIPFKKLHINENPFLISHLINLWKKTGKKPTFVVRNVYHPVIEGVIFNLNSHNSISGNITYNLQPLSMVSWEGGNQAISSGHYSFPFLAGEDIFLKPVKPGYRFIPEKISLENVRNNLIQNFIALPLDLGHRLIAYYPFENNFRDTGPGKNHGQGTNVLFVEDAERGHVASFKDESFIRLPNAETLGLHNHDFTVSAWIKAVPPPTERRDISILGSEEIIYRQGLHLQLRELKPYFGFYANDLTANSEIRYNEWVHLVWRYTKNTGEQAIFINGKPDKISYKHPSFMGRGDIFIGKSIQMHNYMNGFIDDLAIWDRPLGNEEIWKLYQEVMPLWQPTTSQRTGYFFYLVLLPALLLFGYALWRKIYKKKQRVLPLKQPGYNINQTNSTIPPNNIIRLFGEFQVTGPDGTDLTIQFTPKVRQLFVLLLLYSHKTRRGITSDEINQLLWHGHTKKNATNNRGVNMNKLRQVLSSLQGVRIDNQMENWTISIDNNILFCDYYVVLGLLKNKTAINNQSNLTYFFSIVERGPLLMNWEDEWLDEFKGHISSEVIDTLLKYLTFLSIEKDHETVVRICDRILLGDPFNEEALEIKIKTLLKNNHSNQARYTYQWFSENYEKCFGTPYRVTFEQILSN